jgi:hypothetical protein
VAEWGAGRFAVGQIGLRSAQRRGLPPGVGVGQESPRGKTDFVRAFNSFGRFKSAAEHNSLFRK